VRAIHRGPLDEQSITPRVASWIAHRLRTGLETFRKNGEMCFAQLSEAQKRWIFAQASASTSVAVA
jgi:hypothetical protein